jgi:hypothetical protein
VSAHHMLHGPDFGSGSHFQREQRHRRIIVAKCCPTTVQPIELAATIGADGNIIPWKARDLVSLLISRAHDDAVAQTFGFSTHPPAASSDDREVG